LLSDFVSIENKEAMNKIPKLKVAGSIPVARSNLLSNFVISIFIARKMSYVSRKRPADSLRAPVSLQS
jgi:hypothetical protein